MAGVAVIVVDKAVSTEDLGVVTRDIHLEVARLEAMLNTLVENKVESLKADNKDKDKNNKQRITSTSTTASSTGATGRKHHHRGRHHHKHESSHRHRHHHHRHREVTAVYCEHDAVASVVEASDVDDDDELMMDEAFDFLAYHHEDQLQDQADECHCSCGCPIEYQDDNQIMKLPYEDYISIPIDLPSDLLDDPLAPLDCSSDSQQRRARRKRRRRRRKRRRRERLAAAAAVTAAAAAAEQRRKRKTLDDDLPQRARWTIVATACLLLVMCLLLVGVTLRMAPIIDDMVRKENEELMNSLQRESSSTWNSTSTTAAPAVGSSK